MTHVIKHEIFLVFRDLRNYPFFVDLSAPLAMAASCLGLGFGSLSQNLALSRVAVPSTNAQVSVKLCIFCT
jgi:hypothetical protein